MSLKSKIEAVIYASEEPVTLQQLVGLLAEEAQAELDALASDQASLPLDGEGPGGEATSGRSLLEAGTHEPAEAAQPDAAAQLAVNEGEVTTQARDGSVSMLETSSRESASQAEDLASGEGTPVTEQNDAAAAPELSGEDEKRRTRERERAVRDHVRRSVDLLIREYAESDRGIEIREVASGFRMGTKPEYHDAVRGFVKSLKPALKLTLPALETLAVVAYKQPVTAAEISEIRGVDSAGVLGGLMARKLIATAGRKQVIGRPMLYKTTRDFLLRFGLKDVNELPSMEEFERMAGELAEQEDLPMEGADSVIEQANARGDAEMMREEAASQQGSESGLSNDQQHNATAESAAGGSDEAASQQVSEPAGQPNERPAADEEVAAAN